MSSRRSGPDLVDVVAEQRRGELQLARAHPVAVSAQGVDLAVVREHPVRVGELPAREGVGREARVDERQPARHALVAQVGVVARELRRGEHPLEDDRAGAEARDRELVEADTLDHAPDHVQLALEQVLVADALARAHEQLGDARRVGTGRGAAGALGDRHLAPAEHDLALGLDRLLEHPHGVRGVAAREEAHRHAVEPRGRQLAAGLRPQELIRKLQQDPRAVTRVRIRPLRAAVLEMLERGERLLDHLVRSGRPQPGHEGDAAGIMLVGRVVQAARCLQGHLTSFWIRAFRARRATGWGSGKDTDRTG